MRRPALTAVEVCLVTIAGLSVSWHGSTLLAQALPPAIMGKAVDRSGELQLEVFVNDVSSQMIATFHQDADGQLAIDPKQLRNVGLLPRPEALRADGLMAIAKLPHVSYRYDESVQSIYFTTSGDAQTAHVIDASRLDRSRAKAQSSIGALVNYSVYTSAGGTQWRDLQSFRGISGSFEARAFSPWGVLSSSQVVSLSPDSSAYGSTRLDTDWSYSDEGRLLTYRVGDLITGGLSWTRPSRLGGLQIQRSFSLRPDLVTMPLPQLSGSAAVPSTVDVYIDNTRRLSSEVPSGPFAITNLPVVTGDGTARLVVRDALGRETVSETPFYASGNLLASGLFDFSAETGFARNFYGTESNAYDDRPMGSAILRYGLSNGLTVEAHAEGGAALINGGLGTVFNLDDRGVGSLAAAASRYDGATGYQLAGTVETELWGMRFYARSQRTFGDYNDIASVTDDSADSGNGFSRFTAKPPRALDQLSVSVPLGFDPTTLNLSLTQLQSADGDGSRILGVTANRPIGKRGNVFLTAYKDFQSSDSFGLFAGISWSFGNDISASSGISADRSGPSLTADLVKSEKQDVGSLGWRLHDAEGDGGTRSASASYRVAFGRMEAGVMQYGSGAQATAQIDGAAVFAGGDMFLANRIDDAFAVVDAGAPGIDVQLENRPIGQTGRSGRMLVPNLRSYDDNRISIDPSNLPLDATIDSTNEIVVPRGRSGAVVNFGVKADSRAVLVRLRTADGTPVETGATGKVAGSGIGFVVGYDGEAYVPGLAAGGRLTVDQPDGGRCQADVAKGKTTADLLCQAAP